MQDYETILKRLVGIRFIQFRDALGKNQQQMAEELKIPETTISDIESGTIPPPKTLVDYLNHTYGMNPKWLIDGIGTMYEVEYVLKCNTASFIMETFQNPLYKTA